MTHFSQRYPKVPPEIDSAAADKAAVAFDGMRVPFVALPDLQKVLPLLCQVWEEVDQDQEIARAGIPTTPSTGIFRRSQMAS